MKPRRQGELVRAGASAEGGATTRPLDDTEARAKVHRKRSTMPERLDRRKRQITPVASGLFGVHRYCLLEPPENRVARSFGKTTGRWPSSPGRGVGKSASMFITINDASSRVIPLTPCDV